MRLTVFGLRLREGKPFLVVNKSGCDSSIKECKDNMDVLVPLLHRFFAARLKLPEIGPLRAEIEACYKMSGKDPGESEVDDDGWDLRTMLRFVKRKANRNDPSTDS